MAQSFDSWLSSLGPITRHALATAVLLTTSASLGVVPYPYLLLSPTAFTQLHLWRPITAALFFGGFSFPWLISIAMFVMYANYNETQDFKGKSGDFLWMGLMLIAIITSGGLLLGLPVTSSALMMSLCWVFCKRHPEMRMSLYSFEFNANTFPWVLLAFHFVLGHNIMEDILGIVAGHAFFFFRDVVPRTHGVDLLRTQSWFLRYVFPNSGAPNFGTLHPAAHPYDTRFARRPQQTSAGDGNAGGATHTHRWGAGRVLGSG